MHIDLHMHTQLSDGEHPPETVLEMAYSNDTALCALTDHDTLQAYFHLEALNLPDLVFLPGVEITTENLLGKESHLLVYFPRFAMGTKRAFKRLSLTKQDPPTMADIAGLEELETELSLLREKRIERAKLCLEVLSSTYGLDLSWDEFCTLNRINQKINTADGTIGRPHIANYLIHKGYCTTVRESFDKYLAKEPIESLKKEMLPLQYAITRAIQLGGVPVLAHACLKYDWDATVKVLEEAVQSGMKHLEVYHPSHTQKNILHLKQYCDRHGLIASMGSDFHGDSPQYSSRIPPGGYEDARHTIDPAEKKKLVRSLFKQSS
ncbi:Metal-dependent phosphoesterase, PHP family protein [Giardia duodenalis]|uniref:Metal-dependent phosphoesterase, PHP family protein n=1 Tax=Giardia intestinalis TaxID=5741 RepID=V6TM41_GIAIN|nr:Metal-dependent phosphoesterase, PHP family protein [Giardia intestinalis]